MLNPTQKVGDIVFLGRLLEHFYNMMVKIDTDPSCTLQQVKEDIYQAAIMVKEEIGEKQL